MDYTRNMNLESPSGYAMPFEDPQGSPQVLLPFGRQVNPKTGEEFDHQGVDFRCKTQELYAVGSGVVSGVMSDRVTGFQLTVTYGDYDVTYRPITQAKVNIGQSVRAGMPIAVSGSSFLHIGVKYKGEVIDPMEFLQMIYGNYLSYNTVSKDGSTQYASIDIDVKTKFDADQQEVESMMKKFFIPYFADIIMGAYKVPESTTTGISELFNQARNEKLFFESIPSLANPLGLGERSSSLAGMMLNFLIGDFLNYMAVRHRVFLSTWGEAEKKNILGGMM